MFYDFPTTEALGKNYLRFLVSAYEDGYNPRNMLELHLHWSWTPWLKAGLQ